MVDKLVDFSKENYEQDLADIYERLDSQKLIVSTNDPIANSEPVQWAVDELQEELSRTEEELVNARQENTYLADRIKELEDEAELYTLYNTIRDAIEKPIDPVRKR